MKLIFTLFSFYCIIFLLNRVEASIKCPEECECYTESGLYNTNCANKKLKELPMNIDKNIEKLDLSNNSFDKFPDNIPNFIYLKKLNMSGNKLTNIKSHGLQNLTILEELDLSHNAISEWEKINPNHLLLPTINLRKLILSYNDFKNFSNLNHSQYLVSDSLEILDLSNCQIMIMLGTSPLSRLNNLKTLILNNNPIKFMMPLHSPTLESLYVSHCDLRRVSSGFISFLPFLTYLNLSYNSRLVLKETSLFSTYLKHLDLSYCNMNEANINGLLNVATVILKGNMIRHLLSERFYNNSKLEHLDLSSNAIEEIHERAFYGLTSLEHLNLSVNVIPSLPSNLFLATPNLLEVFLSRNYISTINNLQSKSIKMLDISVCEIQFISHDAFTHIPSLIELNLSRNLLSYIPSLKSTSLQILDLSFNRITLIDNLTFKFLPALTTLHLYDNRFTSTWKVSYFANNKYITEISLHDNMWRCDCFEEEMKNFFEFLTKDPPKVWDMNTIKCHSPSNVSGDNWIRACYAAWYSHNDTQSSRPLNFLIALLCAFFLFFIIMYMVRRTMRKKHTAELEERQRRTMDARERLREIEMRREQEEERNAPDPRDLMSPPSYSEALLMPKLDGSFHSLSNLDINQRKQKRRMRRRTRSSGDLLEDSETLEERKRRRQQKCGQNYNYRHRSQSTNEINDQEITTEEARESEDTNKPLTRLHESDL